MLKLSSLLFFVLSTSLYAQEKAQTAGAQPSAPNPLMSFAPFVLIFVVFYFLIIRPNKKRMAEEQKMVSALKSGDEVYTKSGIIGTITGSTDKVVTLEVSEGVKIKVLKSEVAGPSSRIFAVPTKK